MAPDSLINHYDVFISKNSRDKSFAEEVRQFLLDSGVSVFDSSHLPALGSADYAHQIDEALESSDCMIIICSNHELANGKRPSSRWVYYEWTTFRNEILSGRKNGNILTILKDKVAVKDIDIGLRKYESMDAKDYKQSILGYVKPGFEIVNPSGDSLHLKSHSSDGTDDIQNKGWDYFYNSVSFLLPLSVPVLCIIFLVKSRSYPKKRRIRNSILWGFAGVGLFAFLSLVLDY